MDNLDDPVAGQGLKASPVAGQPFYTRGCCDLRRHDLTPRYAEAVKEVPFLWLVSCKKQLLAI